MSAILLAGFWSYVHSDDAYERGRIVRLRERLEQSVRFHSGQSQFQIFLDRKDIGWGQQWEDRIKNSLNDALLLIPIITPSYFSSSACKQELEAFVERQKKLERDDLILPIYYLTADLMEGHHGDADVKNIEIAQLLLKHQYEDFRALRASEETDPSYSQAIERLGAKAHQAGTCCAKGQTSPTSIPKSIEDEGGEQVSVASEAQALKGGPGPRVFP